MTDQPRETLDWTGGDVLWISLGGLVLTLAGIIGWDALTGQNIIRANPSTHLPPYYNVGIAGIELCALISSVYLLGLRRRHLSWTSIGFRSFSRNWLAISLLMATLLVPLVGLIALGIQLVLGLPLDNPQLDFLAPQEFTWAAAAAMLLLVGIAIPIAEELYFRGVLYSWLRNRFGAGVGMTVSALVFGALHGDISLAVATFVMGLFLAWIYEQSQSLWLSILIHGINNSIKVILLYLLIALGIDIPGL